MKILIEVIILMKHMYKSLTFISELLVYEFGPLESRNL